MKLTRLNWFEICCVFADLGNCELRLRVSPSSTGDTALWFADFVWYNVSQNEHLPIGWISSGFGCQAETSDLACKKLLRRTFKYGRTFPGNNRFAIPVIEFESKSELELKLDIAGIDVKYMLTHRSG